MAEAERVRAADVIGKSVVSEETGRKFGVVANVDFVTESGELLNLIVDEPTKYLTEMNLKTDEKGRVLIPFSAVKSVGDFVIVSESELI
ncbi:MAG: PRC-barrel domain-containing protein [Candidatus Aenigmatarchaeota archaeon]